MIVLCMRLKWTFVQVNFLYVVMFLQLEFFTTFKDQHPNAPIAFSGFHAFKPWFIRKLMEWNTCCCRYHTKLKLLVNGLNDMQSHPASIHIACLCKCPEVCAMEVKGVPNCPCPIQSSLFSGITHTFIMCVKPLDSMWHKNKCLLRECPNCGIQNLKIYSHELLFDQRMKWWVKQRRPRIGRSPLSTTMKLILWIS